MSDKNDPILCAAATMDWQQVVLNGGPPCFYLEPGKIKFCGRAERWAGHGKAHHEFVSLRELIETVERNVGEFRQIGVLRPDGEFTTADGVTGDPMYIRADNGDGNG